MSRSWHDLDAVLFSLTTTLAGIPATVGDPSSSRTVYAIVIALLLIGLVLIGIGIWLIRQTRVDLDLLGPLERMDDRRWRKLDPVGQRRLLDDARPDGADPVQRTPTEPEVDSDFARSEPPVPSFDDLEPIDTGTSEAEPPPVADTTLAGLEAVATPDPRVTEPSGESPDDDSEVFAGDRVGEPAASEDDR